MTSFAFILGCVPLWTASGAGAVARQIMGTTVIGGMVAASGIGIFLIPAIFYLVEKFPETAHPVVPVSRNSPCPGRETNMRRSSLSLIGSVVLAACTVGPNYKRPAVPTPQNFRAPDPLPPAQAASFADLKWFEVFKDEQLQALIRRHWSELRSARRRGSRRRSSCRARITRSNQYPNSAPGVREINRLSRDGARRFQRRLALAESEFWNRRAECCPSKSTSGESFAAPPSRARQSAER